ncbi:MAG: twin-arginine translocase subunit TatC [Cardiobacteriaceae bacterium]|nr:twin-arginine translocase subunit TatC [Cardiobacteriaceae bacterium]
MKNEESKNEDKEMPIVEHLIELRARLLHIIYAVLGTFIVLLPFRNRVYEAFALPVLNNLLPGQSMLAYDGIDIFLTPIKVCLFLSCLLTAPWILYQIWAFVAPGMYRHEKQLVRPILISSTILFYTGVLFAYFIILPILFSFLAGIELKGVEYKPDITQYMSLSLTMFIAFGAAFEVPVATVICIMLGIVSPETLAKKRPYIILAAFVIGMLLTPPDALSQTLLAVPMLILFEAGLYIGKRILNNRKN